LKKPKPPGRNTASVYFLSPSERPSRLSPVSAFIPDFVHPAFNLNLPQMLRQIAIVTRLSAFVE
jgi:hypothetical protein